VEKNKKSKIIDQIYENKDTEIVRCFIALMETLIDENRERNDTDRAEDVLVNQGAIKLLRYLRDIFTKHPVIVKK